MFDVFLKYFLLFIALYRMTIGYFCYFNNDSLKKQYNESQIKTINPIFSRSQGIWFFGNGVTTLITAFNLDCFSTVCICTGTLIVGFPHIINEALEHKTMKIQHFMHIGVLASLTTSFLFYHLLTFNFVK